MLREIQSGFSRSLIAGDSEGSAHILPGKLSAEARLEIYRHNVFTNLSNALGDIFPVVKRVVGEGFFREAARVFIRDVPSTSGDLNRYGAAFGDFLAAYPHAAELPYLADVARMEWAWQEAFHAAEAAPLDLARLAAIPAERHGGLRFVLHPSARLLASDYPLLAIWKVNQEGYSGEMAVEWDSGREHLLVFRPERDVGMQALTATEWHFLQACSQGADLETAIDYVENNAGDSAPDESDAFNLQGFLVESVQSGLIVNFLENS